MPIFKMKKCKINYPIFNFKNLEKKNKVSYSESEVAQSCPTL